MMESMGFVVLGLVVGALSGLLGVGGGIILIPALVLVFGFSQQSAQGTTLAMMVPPIGFFAALQYHRAGHVNMKAAAILAVTFAVGAFAASRFIHRVQEDTMRRIFAVFLLFVAGHYLFGGGARPGVPWSLAGVGAFLGGRALKPKKPGGTPFE